MNKSRILYKLVTEDKGDRYYKQCQKCVSLDSADDQELCQKKKDITASTKCLSFIKEK